ncbi:ABC transporter ATP-binding protein [Desulfobaculum bizertense]|uniref:Iron complex transport system ATP-binding protein n=1 Tax=Desulfobaculum bizertense DSM 18034 TaxID=1121442 RepID=A0A1T4VQ26_9BACT|nr:ABC transporter ATP-binding protein [Desulfobaculum bizertense]UIJ38265.1 ABC transporter ATP-binding protein [Desulfobaculum bizertense]SKA67047.1 iron complex transport system ATP-binding protein [Desulfobaculum bizertense DSM 18034]
MILSVSNLNFDYGAQRVLHQIRFALDHNEILAILGPNGSGKTTLLKNINSILTPSQGNVMVEGHEILSMKLQDVAKLIGYVPQKTDSARITVFDAVLLGRTPHMSWSLGSHDIDLVHNALRLTGLDALALRMTDQLSGGELQKVAIARAIVQEPKLMLLDEPTSALDLKSQINILNTLKGLVTAQHLAAVITLHDINAALRYADKLIFLKSGRIHKFCSATDISSQLVEDVYELPVDIVHVHGTPFVVPTAAM